MKVNIRDVKDGHFSLSETLAIEKIQLIENEIEAASSFNVDLKGDKFESNFLLTIHFNGNVRTACDRCLNEFTLSLNDSFRLMLTRDQELSEHEHDDFDDVLLIHEDDIELDISDYINQAINLAIPMKRVHPEGKTCRHFDEEQETFKSLSENEELKKLKERLS